MSDQPLWLRDLAAYSIQAAALVAVGAAMAGALRLRVPKVRLAYWQGLLALCLFLPLLQPWRPEALDLSGAVASNITLAASAPPASPSLSLAEIVLLLICAGIVLRAAWMALGLVRLWLYRRQAQRIAEAPQAVTEAQRLAPVSPELFISRQLTAPATFGFFRPVILFPAAFLEMEASMQKAIALHELVHVERRDWLWNMFEELVLTLLWFHIPVWWVVRSIRLSREQVVDAEAVRRGKARRPYLKALLEMAQLKPLADSLPAALFLRESQLAERVALMMKEVHMSRTRLTVSILAAAGVLLIAGASVVWAFPLKTSAQPTETPEVSGVAAGTSLPGDSSAAEADSTQKNTKVHKVGGDVIAPYPIYKPEPPYTPQARKNHLNGTAVFSVVIDAQGRVAGVKQLSKPLGQGLDESAMNTVRTWKFKPAMRNGVPVAVRVMVKITFKIDGKPGEAPQKPNAGPDPQPDPTDDPPAQSGQNTSANKNQSQPNPILNQAEIQRQVEQTMKQAKIAQEAAAKIDQAKIQKQVEEAMKQAKIAQQAVAKLDQQKIQRQMQEAVKQVEKLNTREMRHRMQEAMKQAEKLNSAEMQQRFKQALEQARIAQQAAEKINKAEIQRQVEQAMRQVQASQQQLKEAQQKLEKQLKPAKPTTPPSILPSLKALPTPAPSSQPPQSIPPPQD